MAASAYHIISKEVENQILMQLKFYTHLYKQPTLTQKWN